MCCDSGPSDVEVLGRHTITETDLYSVSCAIQNLWLAARAALLAVLERAHSDAEESVRVQAVAAVAAWPNRHEVEGDLRAIAGADRAQAVRYEAERALFRN